jgi:uncharacterized protein (TIGR02145 family)
MTKRILLLSIIVFSFLLSCEDEKITNPKPDEVKYDTVKICEQVWMIKNLDVDKYRNGDIIIEVKDADEWENLETGAWCYYNNDPELGKIYGKLYNWYAVNDPRGLAPQGWHVASDSEWTELENCLGGSDVAGGKLKSTGTIERGGGLWRTPNEGATNSSGFYALPGGLRQFNGSFHYIGRYGDWWSASEVDAMNSCSRFMYYYLSSIDRYNGGNASSGFAVRCVRDY